MFWQNKLWQAVVHHKPYQNIYKSQNRGFFKNNGISEGPPQTANVISQLN